VWRAVCLAQAAIEEAATKQHADPTPNPIRDRLYYLFVVAQHRPDLVIGFSGRGAVGWELCTARQWCGPSILLAPTVSAAAKYSCAAVKSLPPATAAQCHVFHGGHDTRCPEEQHQYMTEAGCVARMYPKEDHVLRGAIDGALEAVELAEKRPLS